ncbi:MAG: TonB-dependent receptor, partial [Saprospiraceae bacterium]|nr:TonB-dependent receptor [Saprospiraceae bacterium]
MKSLQLSKRLGCWLALLFASVGLSAQDVKGYVTSTDSVPIVGAVVSMNNSKWIAITDRQGMFIMSNVPDGVYDLLATCLGYANWQSSIRVSADRANPINVQLAETIMGLPEVVVKSVSLTGGLKGLRDIPGSAHYISPKELEQFSYTDINRVLRAVPGINLQEEDGFGLRPNIGLRGSGSERSSKITIMEDGILAAPAPYSAPAAYYFPTIGRMNAVEVLKGSSQIRFGPHTNGGAINLLSTPIPEQLKGRLHITGGSFGNRNVHAFVGNSHQNIGYLVETFQYKSNGFKHLDNGDTGFDKKDFLAKVRMHSKPNAKLYQSLTLKLGQSDETSQETYLGLTIADFKQDPFQRYAASQLDEMNTRHRQYSIQHIIELSKSMDITTHVYRNDFHRNWYKLDKVVNDGELVGISKVLSYPDQYREAFSTIKALSGGNSDLIVKANNRTYRSEGIQTMLGFEFETSNIKHRTDVGIRYHQDEVDRFQWVDAYDMQEGIMHLTTSGIPGTESNRVEWANALASYIQHKVSFGKWTLIPGLRYENIQLSRSDYGKEDPDRSGTNLTERSNHVDVWIPGFGVDFKFNSHLAIFGGVHKGFSPPGTREESRAEESLNLEGGVRYNTAALSSQLIAFVSRFDNLLGSDFAAAGGSGTNDLFNGGSVHTNGIEMQ